MGKYLIVEGFELRFALTMLFFAVSFLGIYRTRAQEKLPFVRRIAGMDGVEELVGRAAEMGKPICWTNALMGQWYKGGAEYAVAALGVLGYTARVCARVGARLVTCTSSETTYQLALQNIRQGYTMEGKPELMRLEDHEYFPHYSFNTGVCDVQDKHQIASMIIVGSVTHEASIIMENAAKWGAMQLGGTSGLSGDMAMMTAGCDFQLFAEELLVAGAYASGNKTQLGSIVGSDWSKLIIMTLGVLTLILTGAGISVGW